LKITKGIEDPSHCQENCINLWYFVTNCCNTITNMVGQYEQNGQKLTFCLGSLWLGNNNIVNKKICFKAVWVIHSSTIKVQWNIFIEINLLHSIVNCTAYLSLLNLDMYHAQICWYFAFTVNKEYAHSIQFVCPYDNTI
jgi:hypothetical protein